MDQQALVDGLVKEFAEIDKLAASILEDRQQVMLNFIHTDTF